MLFIFTLISAVTLVLGADTPCTSQGGTCQDDSMSCEGGYQSGLCDGPTHRRCCLQADSSADEQCTSHTLQDGRSGIGCVKNGCCQYDLQLGDLCSGDDVCCFTSDTCGGGGGAGGCPNIVSRAEWGAQPPRHPLSDMDAPAKYVFIHHGSSSPCHDQATCERILRGYQDYHMSPEPQGHGWTDIGYNFVVGEDGNAYMARGWTAVGAHTYGYNSVGIAICVIGDFNHRVPNDAALNTIKALIQCGLSNGHIDPNYTLKGHRDVGSTDCPGQQLYDLIHSWPHYVSGSQTYGR